MKNFIKGREEGTFLFTNKQVENILNMDSDFNKNHTSKMLYAQIEIYQITVQLLLEERSLNNKK